MKRLHPYGQRRGPYLPWRRRRYVQAMRAAWQEVSRLATVRTPGWCYTDENVPVPCGVAPADQTQPKGGA